MNDDNRKIEKAILGGGCFWCLEAVFLRVRGVESVTSGYAGGILHGNDQKPTYEQVCTGKTRFAEVVQVRFDAEKISYENILHIFFSLHDPTLVNRQGNDIGSQYRSVILFLNEEQKMSAELVRNEFIKLKVFEKPIVTEIVPSDRFFPAEEYHQNYFEKNPENAYCQAVISPKLSKLKKKFGRLYKLHKKSL